MTISAPRWDLTNVYPSLESDEFKAAIDDYKKQVAAFERFFKNKLRKTDSKTKAKELAPLVGKAIDQINSIETLAYLRGQHPGLPVVVVSAQEDPAVIRRAIAHGASGYIPKSASVDTIVTAVRRILDGDVWLPPHVSESSGALDDDEASAASRIAELTPQQFRVLGMIAAGLLNKQIAFELNVSEATIKAHMTAIMRKLHVSNRTQVALYANHLALEQAAGLQELIESAG